MIVSTFGLYGVWPSYVPRALIVQQQYDIFTVFHCTFLIVTYYARRWRHVTVNE